MINHSSELSIIAWISSSFGVDTDYSYSLCKNEFDDGTTVCSSFSYKNMVDWSKSLFLNCIKLIAYGSF